MTFSLYAATIPSYQQVLGAVSGLLGTAEANMYRDKQLRRPPPAGAKA